MGRVLRARAVLRAPPESSLHGPAWRHAPPLRAVAPAALRGAPGGLFQSAAAGEEAELPRPKEARVGGGHHTGAGAAAVVVGAGPRAAGEVGHAVTHRGELRRVGGGDHCTALREQCGALRAPIPLIPRPLQNGLGICI